MSCKEDEEEITSASARLGSPYAVPLCDVLYSLSFTSIPVYDLATLPPMPMFIPDALARDSTTRITGKVDRVYDQSLG